jgi:cytochrome c5
MRALVVPVALVSVACGRDAGQTARDSTGAAARGAPAFRAAPPEVAAKLAPPPAPALLARLASDDRAATNGLPAGQGRDIVLASCLTCHSAALITQQHKDTAGWNKTVSQMIAWGTPVSTAQKDVLVAYLSQSFPAVDAGPSPRSMP